MIRFYSRPLSAMLIAGTLVAASALQPTQAMAQSSSFSYYNPRNGMQYSQGYSFQGRNFSNYWSYGPPRSYGYGSSYGRGTQGGYSHTPYYSSPTYSRPYNGYQPNYRSSRCR